MGGFTLLDMLEQGWPILSVLLLLSIWSITIIVDRWMALRRSKGNAWRMVRNVIRSLETAGPNAALDYCEKSRLPEAVTFAAVLVQPGGREARERAMERSIQMQMRGLEWGIPALGTIASIAPFIGLLGTVMGIIKAFAGIAANAGGGTEAVAAGIAEALVTTACGLLVAIPALVGYNTFVHRIRALAQEIELATEELIDRLVPPDGPTP